MPFSSDFAQDQRISTPPKQVSLRFRRRENPLRLERRALAENLLVGLETDFGAALLHAFLHQLDVALRHAALVDLAIQAAAAGDLDFQRFRQRIRDRDADAVQAAGSFIGIAAEFSARMQRRHDDFERRFFLELRMILDRNAAAVVGDGDKAVVVHLDLDEGRMARDCFVHRVVDDFGEQVMQRALVGAADIHAGGGGGRAPSPPKLQSAPRRIRPSRLFSRAPCRRTGQALLRRALRARRISSRTSSRIWPLHLRIEDGRDRVANQLGEIMPYHIKA